MAQSASSLSVYVAAASAALLATKSSKSRAALRGTLGFLPAEHYRVVISALLDDVNHISFGLHLPKTDLCNTKNTHFPCNLMIINHFSASFCKSYRALSLITSCWCSDFVVVLFCFIPSRSAAYYIVDFWF